MSDNTITVNTQRVYELAGQLNDSKEDVPYSREYFSVLNDDRGDAKNELFTLDSNTSMCVNVTRQLLECTKRFLNNVAKQFESEDETIAREVTEN